ncbi:MAG TPA: MBL fold metallo-hydrolase [Gaiellaceae bacterium]
MRVTLLGTGGGAPSATRDTSCVLVRDRERALLLDAGTGARRLLADADLLAGLAHVDVVLTHFHFDHVCGLPWLQWLDVETTIWAPGKWLYGTASAEVVAPLRRPPISPNDISGLPVRELVDGTQSIGGFEVRAGAQPRHWAPSVGFRIEDDLAYITDTPYERSSAELARGVRHLLHEAWSSSRAPNAADRDATAADAARVASEAGVGDLTLVHLDPRFDDFSGLVDDARAGFDRVAIGEDSMVLT